MKKYLRFTGEKSTVSVIAKYVFQFKDSIEWVDSVDEATTDDLISIQETQTKADKELGMAHQPGRLGRNNVTSPVGYPK